LGGHRGCPSTGGGVSPCAYLCYSHTQYGTAVIPHALWRHAQQAEGGWAASVGAAGGSDDRSAEHWEGFGNYQIVPTVLGEGSVIEIGSGPWTQTKGLLHKRADLHITKFSIFEPMAEWYMKNVATCSYKTGKLARFAPTTGGDFHDFPLHIFGNGGESLLTHGESYDALVCMNVIEHVQNGFAFLQGLHRVLKPGGVLIFHERFFADPPAGDGVLGTGGLHPIRLKREVLDIFLAQFDGIWKNSRQTSGMVARGLNEHGYYFIGRKK